MVTGSCAVHGYSLRLLSISHVLGIVTGAIISVWNQQPIPLLMELVSVWMWISLALMGYSFFFFDGVLLTALLLESNVVQRQVKL